MVTHLNAYLRQEVFERFVLTVEAIEGSDEVSKIFQIKITYGITSISFYDVCKTDGSRFFSSVWSAARSLRDILGLEILVALSNKNSMWVCFPLILSEGLKRCCTAAVKIDLAQ